MKRTLLFPLTLLIASSVSAQISRPMRQDEVDFENKVSTALLAALPREFKGWEVTFPANKPLVAGESRIATCNHGTDCFYDFGFHIVYDGTTLEGDDRTKFQDSMKTVSYDWRLVALMTRYTNSHQLVVNISVNESQLLGDFRYCGTQGFKTLTPPAGFDHYYFASVSACFPEDAKNSIPDIHLLTIGDAPVISDRPHGSYNNANVVFTLKPGLPSALKIQNLVIRIQGSKALVQEFLQKTDFSALKKLL
jgi:hypothetical protein